LEEKKQNQEKSQRRTTSSLIRPFQELRGNLKKQFPLGNCFDHQQEENENDRSNSIFKQPPEIDEVLEPNSKIDKIIKKRGGRRRRKTSKKFA